MWTSGCSSARLEYTSGGRVVAGSNPVIPTEDKGVIFNIIPFLFLYHINKRHLYLQIAMALVFLNCERLFTYDPSTNHESQSRATPP